MSAGFEVEALIAERVSGAGDRFRLEAGFRTGGGITVVFGPSGAGKSTLLLAILGCLAPRRGRISVAGRELFDSGRGVDLAIRERRIGIVFQDALLFPHLDVRGNVGFGIRGGGGAGRTREAERMLERVEALALARRMPAELSGGERQRVAVARALAARPDALLLDEPFSALDARAREALGQMLIALDAEIGIPFLHVTHDVGEALRLGSQVIVLDQGRVVGQGAPAAVFSGTGPAAAWTGTDNFLAGVVLEHLEDDGYTRVEVVGGTVVETPLLALPRGGRVVLRLPAEDILVSLEAVRQTSARNVLAGQIEGLEPLGAAVAVRVATPAVLRARITRAAARELRLVPGMGVHLLIKAHSFRVA